MGKRTTQQRKQTMSDTTAALEANGLGKRYRTKWGLKDCTLSLPSGRVAALVGPNGSGKSTLLRMAAGITRPTTGDIRVFGRSPQHQRVEALTRIGYLDQERPLYKTFKVSEMLRMGRELNPRWDDSSARSYLGDLGIALDARVGRLSVGQQAQVAVTLCIAKRPDLLLLDEPVAALDPLARSQLMHPGTGPDPQRATERHGEMPAKKPLPGSLSQGLSGQRPGRQGCPPAVCDRP
jgi:ABC-2 type transport system ATP-binding protein